MPKNLIHLTDRTGQITCRVETESPLPATAYQVIARLAEAVADAEIELDAVLGRRKGEPVFVTVEPTPVIATYDAVDADSTDTTDDPDSQD